MRLPRTGLATVRVVGVPLLLAAVVSAHTPGWTTLRVQSGDTVYDLAREHGTTAAAIVQLNRLSGNGRYLHPGQVLRIPGAQSSSAGSAASATTTARYTVRPGDTVDGIAARLGSTRRAILAANNLPSNGLIVVGRTLVVPGARASAAAEPASPFNRTYPDALRQSAAQHRAILAQRPEPSKATVRATITATARRYGVDPSLALAIAYQESGFQHNLVSVADAIGTMQVIPSSGEFVSTQIAGRHLDLLDLQDNVTAGVLLLRQHLRVTSEQNAVAAYYQGLRSVRENGMYADTKVYVRNVMTLRQRF